MPAGRGRGRGKYVPPTGARLQLQKAAEECGYDARNLRSLQSRPDLFPDIELHSSGFPMHIISAQQQTNPQDSRQPQPQPQPQSQSQPQIVSNQPQRGITNKVKIEEGDNSSPKKKENTNTIKTVKRSVYTSKLIQKGREMHHRIQHSPFYVQCSKGVPDVIRYKGSAKVSEDNDNHHDEYMKRNDDNDVINHSNVVKSVMSQCLGGRKATKQGLFLPDELVYGPKRKSRSGWINEDEDDDENTTKKKNLDDLEKEEKIKKRRIRLGLDPGDDELNANDAGENQFADDEIMEEVEEQDDGGYGVNYYESEGEESVGDGGEAYI